MTDEPLLDQSRFPIVEVDIPRRTARGADVFLAEMSALIEAGRPFVMVGVGSPGSEAPDDVAKRGTWYREHAEVLAQLCKGMVAVIPDDAEREELAERTAGLASAYPFPFAIARDKAEADSYATSMLPPDARASVAE